MYLVVYSTKTEEVTFTGYGCSETDKFEDHWSAHETYEDALKEYRKILLLNDLYSVSIAGVLRSTDYDSIPAGNDAYSYAIAELPKLRTFQIVGRIPDRENRSQTVKAENLKSALRKFEKELYEWEYADQEEVSEVHGVSIYFDAIFEGGITYDPDNPKEV